MVTRAGILCSLAALLSLACGSDARCKPIAHCDVRNAECQAEAQQQAICLRGRDEEAQPIEVEVISAADYEEELREDIEAHPESEERAQMRRGLAQFGLAQAEEKSAEEAAEDTVSQVGAYYSPRDDRIVLIDHGGGADSAGATVTLVHEMVHALQHRSGDTALGGGVKTFDQQHAASALIEGEATLWGDEARTEGLGFSFKDIDYARSLRSYRGGSLGRISQDPDPIDRAYSFSYAFGATYLWPLVEREGPAAVGDAFADPPRTSYAVMHADPWSPEAGGPNDLGDSAVPELELTPVGTMHLGRFMFEVFTELWEPTIELPWDAIPAGEEFVADTLSVFASEDGEVLVSWRLRFTWTSVNIEQTAAELAALNPALRIGFEDDDIWLIAAENEALIEELPEELTWTAAPEADFGYEQEAEQPAARPILCLDRARYAERAEASASK